jgi:hypothetical protein
MKSVIFRRDEKEGKICPKRGQKWTNPMNAFNFLELF